MGYYKHCCTMQDCISIKYVDQLQTIKMRALVSARSEWKIGIDGSMNEDKGKTDGKKNMRQAPSNPRHQDNTGSTSTNWKCFEALPLVMTGEEGVSKNGLWKR